MTRCVVCALSWLLLAAPAQAEDAEHTHAHEHEHEERTHPETERIIVTATPLEHHRDELAIPVQRLDRSEILERNGPTLGETLTGLPGVSTTGFTSGASRPVIRGQDSFRTEVLEDGLTTQDVSRLSPDHGVPVNPLSARTIEVVRGPATLRYGGGAVAGVVNAITGRVPQISPGTPVTADLFGSYGTNADEGIVALVAEGAAADFAWHADGVYQRADDYENGKGDTQNGTFRKGGAASLGGAWLGDGWRLGAAYAHFRNEYGIPEAGEDVEVEMDTNRYRFEADGDLEHGRLSKLRIVGVYSDYEHQEIAGGAVGQTFDNDEFEGRAELLHDEWLGMTGALGLTGRHRDFSAGGEAVEFLAPTDTVQVAGYLFEEAHLLESLLLQGGLRIEGTEVQGTPRGGTKTTRDFVPISGSLGLVSSHFEGWSFGLTGAASQRAPSDVELFARGPHEATGTFELGGVSLDEETAYSGELRITGDVGPVRLELANFITRYDDYVFGNLTGATVDEGGNPVAPTDPDALDALNYEARDALFYGGEIALGADLYELDCGSVFLDAQFDWVRARFKAAPAGEDLDIPRIPPIRWGAGLGLRGDRVRGRLGFLRYEDQQHPGENETPTDAFTLVDLSLGWTLPVFEDVAVTELVFDARNLADEAARNPVAINKDDVLLRGRTFRIGLRSTF